MSPFAPEKVKIRILDTEETRCSSALRKFIGKVRIAEPLSGGEAFKFDFLASTGLAGLVCEPHTIASHLVEVLS